MEGMLVDQLRPEEDAKAKEERVLEVMDGVIAKRQVIGPWPVPGPEVHRRQDEGADRCAQPGERPARHRQRWMLDDGPRKRPAGRKRQAAPALPPGSGP